MTTVVQPPSAEDYNGWADFWRYDIGVNVIPWNKGEGRSNKVSWTEWQDKPIPQELHDPTRLHICGYYESDNPYPKINPGNICELKCDGSHGIVRCTNSLHYFEENGKFIEKGHRYGVIGTIEPTKNLELGNEFVEHILSICGVSVAGNGNGRDRNKPSLASTLWNPGTCIRCYGMTRPGLSGILNDWQGRILMDI